MAGIPWNREETLAAFNFYCRTPFGKLHARNPDIIALARSLGRTPSAVAMKCCNLASFDPDQQARGIKGLKKSSRLDAEIWSEFASVPEQVGYDSELAFSRLTRTSLRASQSIEWENVEGLDKQAVTKVRVNQHLFRSIVLSGYRSQCAVCGLPIHELLVAAHIVPWSVDKSARMNPCNGVCLCALHDRAFDTGILAITPDYKVLIKPEVAKLEVSQAVERFLLAYSGKMISLPDRWRPDPQLLIRHTQIFNSAIHVRP